MIKCSNACPLGKFDGCCHSPCPYLDGCPEACEEGYTDCGQATFDEETGMAVFKAGQIQALQNIATLTRQKKALEDQEKKVKTALYDAMRKYGIKKFESDVLNLTLVEATTTTRVDSAKLKKEFPDVYSKCSKSDCRAGYVTIKIKEGGTAE